jgi:hypothetical protein
MMFYKKTMFNLILLMIAYLLQYANSADFMTEEQKQLILSDDPNTGRKLYAKMILQWYLQISAACKIVGGVGLMCCFCPPAILAVAIPACSGPSLVMLLPPQTNKILFTRHTQVRALKKGTFEDFNFDEKSVKPWGFKYEPRYYTQLYYTDWVITAVENDGQFNDKEIQIGWRIITVNGIDVQKANEEELKNIKSILAEGEKCNIEFNKQVSPGQISVWTQEIADNKNGCKNAQWALQI